MTKDISLTVKGATEIAIHAKMGRWIEALRLGIEKVDPENGECLAGLRDALQDAQARAYPLGWGDPK